MNTLNANDSTAIHDAKAITEEQPMQKEEGSQGV